MFSCFSSPLSTKMLQYSTILNITINAKLVIYLKVRVNITSCFGWCLTSSWYAFIHRHKTYTDEGEQGKIKLSSSLDLPKRHLSKYTTQ